MALVNWLEQVVSVTWYGVRTLKDRMSSSVTAVVGIAGVVAVLVGVLSMAQGFRQAMTAGGSRDVALVLRSGADSEMVSALGLETARLVAEAPGVARTQAGPLASSEAFVIIDLPKRSTSTDANVPLRGVQPAAFAIRDEVRIVDGRLFEWGKSEVIVGRGAAAEFAGLELGSTLQVGSQSWTVVGVFAAGGGIAESEVWTDVTVLQSAYRIEGRFNTVLAKLESPAAFATLKTALDADPRLNLRVTREREFYAAQSSQVYALITVLGTLVALLMAAGAAFGALNTMYTAVASRAREIATLKALGFRSSPVLFSVLFESVLLALVGGVLGGALSYVAFDGARAATLNWQSFSQVAFGFAVTPELIVQGLVYALAIGLVGGALPALRAVRLPVASALREL